jgi:hypothetical protein
MSPPCGLQTFWKVYAVLLRWLMCQLMPVVALQWSFHLSLLVVLLLRAGAFRQTTLVSVLPGSSTCFEQMRPLLLKNRPLGVMCFTPHSQA